MMEDDNVTRSFQSNRLKKGTPPSEAMSAYQADSAKEGYKKTKLGWIPEAWDIRAIKRFGKVITGNTPPTNDDSNYGNTFLFVSPSDIRTKRKITDTEKKLSFKGFERSRIIPQNSVLFVCIGSTIGKVAISDVELITNQQINSIILNNENDYNFLFYQLTIHSKRIKRIAGHQAVPIINKSTFEKFPIFYAPFPEQQKIAQILSTWDIAIEKTEQLIAKKQARKKSLMQQLLTGKRRFKEFVKSEKMQETKFGWIPADWELKKLREIGIFLKGKGISKNEITEKGYPCLTYGEIYTKHNYIIKTYSSYINEESSKESIELHYGDILFAGSGETLEDIGKCVANINNYRAFAGGDIIILRQVRQNPEFLGYLLNQDIVNKQKFQLGQGHSVVHIYSNNLKGVLIPIPTNPEQQKIASTLSTTDKEIEILQKQLDKLKEQKRGLMQKLLTGAVRVKLN